MVQCMFKTLIAMVAKLRAVFPFTYSSACPKQIRMKGSDENKLRSCCIGGTLKTLLRRQAAKSCLPYKLALSSLPALKKIFYFGLSRIFSILPLFLHSHSNRI